MRNFKEIWNEQQKQTQIQIQTEKKIIEQTKLEKLVESDANPIEIIRDFGYKIKLEKPIKKGKVLIFFKESDADDAFILVDGLYDDNYNIEQDEKEIRITLK